MSKIFEKHSKLILVFLIIISSIYPRLWHLDKLPPTIIDEVANARDIDKILIARKMNITDFHWDFSKSVIVHIPVILTYLLLGGKNILLALRFTSVFISIATLIPFFYLSEKLFGKFVAFWTTLLFSSSYYFLQFSRVGWTDIILSLFWGLTLFSLLEVTSTSEKTILFLLAGLIAGLLFYSYRGGYIFIGLSFYYLLSKNFKIQKKSLLKNLTLYTLAIFLTTTPWLLKITKNWDLFNLRQKVVSIKNVELPYHGQTEFADILKYQIKVSLKSWVLLVAKADDYKPENSRYLPLLYPPVNFLIRIFFWIGLIFSLTKIEYLKKILVFLLLMIAAITFGQVLTVNPPNGARALIMLPSIYIIFAAGIKYFLGFYKNAKLAKLSIAILSIIYCVSDIIFYQYWMTWIKV